MQTTPTPIVALVKFKIYGYDEEKNRSVHRRVPVCEPVVEMVKSMACELCDVTVYNLVKQCDTKECVSKVKEYNITSLPAVVVNE